MFRFLRRKRHSPIGKLCSSCQAEAGYGYSERPEADVETIRPLCLKCLVRQLRHDYTAFAGRALVVAPVSGPPVYVFQAADEWQEHFRDSKISADVIQLLERMSPRCGDCGENATFLWVGAQGLSEANFGKLLDQGLFETLLKDNPEPSSVCAQCCVTRISNALEAGNISFLEVCSPKDKAPGFVIPMGY
jgi:hypothetical protein